MKRFVLILFIFLCSCGEVQDNNHGFGYEVDAVDEITGISVRFHKDFPAITLEGISKAYIEVQECMGYSAPGPMVIISTALGSGHVGETYLDPQLILVDGAWLSALDSVLKHEFVHHILHINKFPVEQNKSHESDFFINCAGY